MNDKDKRNIIIIMFVLILQMIAILWLSSMYFNLRKDTDEFAKVIIEKFRIEDELYALSYQEYKQFIER